MKPVRIAIIVSHPIQHFCPQYASISKDPGILLKVFFASALGFKKYHDTNFGQSVAWNNLRLEAFSHEFLNNGQVLPADQHLDATELDNALDVFGPELIIIYGYFQKLQRRSVQWARRKSVPVAYIADSERRHKANVIKEAVKYFWVKHFFRRISYFLTVGNANEDYYRYYGVSDQRMHRMHFPIDIELYQHSYQQRGDLRDSIRDKYGIAADDMVISVVGKLVHWKSQRHIVEALRMLEGTRTTYHLFILGSGEEMDHLKDLSAGLRSNKVYFPGFVTPEELPGYYAATDIYVHPAELEPHSLAISEAIYMGCPVILSNRCGSYGDTDDVQESINGIVYEFGNVDALAEQIRLLSQDRDRLSRFGLESHRIAVKHQAISHMESVQLLARKIRGNGH